MNTLNNTILWTALITPMQTDGSVDFDSLTQCVRAQEDAGNGVLILGSTGEGLALTTEEKLRIVEHVASLEIQVPIMVGIGGHQLPDQITFLESCQHFSIDAFLLVTPLYAKPGPKGQVAWFKALLDVSHKPCMLYNVPSRTGVAMHPSVLSTLHTHDQFWSIKEASGDVNQFAAYQALVPEIPFFSGEDGLMPELAAVGAKGLVSVVSNPWPKATREYVKASLVGIDEDSHQLWKKASAAMFAVSNPIPSKALMASRGNISTPTLRLPLVANELTDITQQQAADQSVQQWLKARI